MANKKYTLTDSNYWETSGVYDITEGKTQREINAAKVPNTRTVNGKALSANITLSSEDIGDDSGAGGANVKASLAALKGSLTNKLFIKSGTISSAHTSSTTTTLATDTSMINANTDIANVWFNTPANITSDYTITTNASGQVQITCTNSAAVTVYVVLFNP